MRVIRLSSRPTSRTTSNGRKIYRRGRNRTAKLVLSAAKKKVVLGKSSVELLIQNWESLINVPVEESTFYHPVKIAEKMAADKNPKAMSPEALAALRAKYHATIETILYPEIGREVQFLKDFLPRASNRFGVYKLTGNDSIYDLFRKTRTDHSPLSAKKIHALGLSEVARIETEMRAIQNEMGYSALSFPAFLMKLREDPNSYFETEDQLLAAFRDAEKRIEVVVGNYFSNIPNVPLELRGIPQEKAPAGSYDGITDQIHRAYFQYNSANLHSVNRFQTHTLFAHEGVPGHHFQITINYFLKPRLGKFRTEMVNSTPFVEGWALYAERLARELGIYDTPGLLLGHLDDEMWRAVRLVVDTGIHAMGWSREQAVEYFMAHSSSDRKGIEAEVDRYAVWPAQALAYKLGQLEILRLREDAKKRLGAKFSIKEFHRVVLESGTITTSLLQRKIEAWVKETLAKGA